MEVVMEKLKQFLGEEKGQATIEYFLLVGNGIFFILQNDVQK
jgi:Flp pilus assembly pilin Flp